MFCDYQKRKTTTIVDQRPVRDYPHAREELIC